MTTSAYFVLFNEIGILSQLSQALVEARLPAGLGAAHFIVLNHLARVGDGHTPLSIARALQTPKSSLTHTLSGLESRGLVSVLPNPADGRSRCVRLTESGRSLREETIAALDPDLSAMARRFEGEDISRILAFLTDLRRYLDGARGA